MPGIRPYAIGILSYLFISVGGANAQLPVVPPATFLLAGQSNMSGRGDMDALTVEERVSDPRIRLLGNDDRWREAADPLDSAIGQVDVVSADRLAAVGPGLFFAREFLGRTGRHVALVPCAKGGSAMKAWKPDSARKTLYGSCLSRARLSNATVSGMLWYQGETDARDSTEAHKWSGRFKAMIKAIRRDLRSPRLPIVFVALADEPAQSAPAGPFPAWTAMQRAQHAFHLRCTAVVSSQGLSRNSDDLHLTTNAHRQLGPALAAAMMRLLSQGCD
ncbi:sialate O-acetylesterase [Sphingobium sp. CR2-8]|uniref:sialate O-acetylesterase n=1 Tax=Sphingobium sp. CR2-8 TaxID=1306534 RepID=UPI002DB888FC|nr:sialate O-acetylesterase [Sphingobium sp. CR2-8]MEC3911865.1 sialate O-acetylesterase [Sphingobium sp. CR2-8]